ncbi:MAG: ATP-binding protein [Opitutus sp.]
MSSRWGGDAGDFVRSVVGALTVIAALEAPIATGAPLPTLTDPGQIWALPQASKAIAQPIRMEGRISYFDARWRMLWFEQNGLGSYIMLGARPPDLHIGQRVLLEGEIVPDKGLSADLVTVKVLRDYEPVSAPSTAGRIYDLSAFQTRVVTAEGFVDSQQYIDADHVRLNLIIDDRAVIGWIKPDNTAAIPQWERQIVRVEALYSARFNPTHTETTVELWIGPEKNLQVISTIAADARFTRALTPVAQLYDLPLGTEVCVRGRVEAHEGGSHLMVRDATGQVMVHSIQQQRISLGTLVEAIGEVAIEGSRWVLKSGLYRRSDDANGGPAAPAAASSAVQRVSDLRLLSLDEASRKRLVKVAGVVTWALPDTDFFFVQDVSGGIRVKYDPAKVETPQLGKYLEIAGTTFNGGLAPAIDLVTLQDLGSLSPPAPKPITFDQAITGREDGQWVEMRGFVQRVDSDGDVRSIHVTTPAGEFIGVLNSPVNFMANPGSLIRMSGVCEATANPEGQLTGVMLRVPFLHSITTEEDAPSDQYDLPLRPVKALTQLGSVREMTRVRLAGTILHAIAGQSLYLEDEGAGVKLLTRQTTPVEPGDKVEAVGILGRDGARIVLREVQFRKMGSGIPPTAVDLGDDPRLRPDLDARLVKVRGTLIDVSHEREATRFTLQSGNELFEATLDRVPGAPDVAVALDSGLELTGIYELKFNDSRQIRSFALRLRSPADVAVYRTPRTWSVRRTLIVCGILGGCLLLGLGWITALRRQVRRQTEQLREQLERQTRLEIEVQRAARLESLGVLAGGIAHDFNNLLTIILGHLGLAMMDEKLPDSTVLALNEIEKGAVRARSLTQQLLTFAKGGEPVRATVALQEIVRETTDAALHGTKVQCEYRFGPELWAANVDKDQTIQAVRNVVLNAVQAMPNGGTLVVRLDNDGNDRVPLRTGRFVRLSISDSGDGISEEILPRIFDPYFSTRKSSSGLGLATVYSIVTKHGGRVEAASTPGKGTTLTLWLPAAESPKKPAPVAPATAPILKLGKSARVLLMDDEPSLRDMGASLLRRMGLDPVVVADGGAAVSEFSIAQHRGIPFELVILDLTIPGGMGGREAMELIRKLDLDVPAIVSSGYSSDPVLSNFGVYGFQAMVPKPYDVTELAQVINRLLRRL